MTPERLREMVDAATPGPWTYEVREGDEWWFGRGNEAVIRPVTGERDPVAVMGTRSDESPDAALIALAPELARLCAEQHEALERLGRSQNGYCPSCPKADGAHADGCLVGRLLARFSSLGEPASGEEGAE